MISKIVIIKKLVGMYWHYKNIVLKIRLEMDPVKILGMGSEVESGVSS